MRRILIIGNSGSGKTWLSQRLSELLNVGVIHFDDIFWEQGGFNKKREREIVYQEITKLSQGDNWIMEGVFGDLALKAIPYATTLIFLNKEWSECKKALISRGSQSSKQLCSEKDAEANFQNLISWASEYYKRNSPSSLVGHSKLYNNFSKPKYELCSRSETLKLLSNIVKKE